MTELRQLDSEDLESGLLPELEELDSLPDVLGDYAECEIELTTDD
jgi:hypothetical protein